MGEKILVAGFILTQAEWEALEPEDRDLVRPAYPLVATPRVKSTSWLPAVATKATDERPAGLR